MGHRLEVVLAQTARDLPVRDNVVCERLGLIGRGRPQGDHRVDYLVFQHVLNDHEIIRAIDDLEDRVARLAT